ncbi:helix-turn-helix domain-containing protein [Sphingomonas lycopersici]|uniref:Helix-turn-helix transcriptional regulator n=1 Tax=Sphingomonas lycopersici TaxID=2951807 RepID=A0AA41ZHX4_9SPHN|nr:helix-turn-helix transcriptional regulator [Sphingomonas lycopersici]
MLESRGELAATSSVWMMDRADQLTTKDCEACFAALDERERDCLRLVGQNYKTKEIARRLNLSVHTVNKIIFDIRSKLNGIYRAPLGRLFNAWEARQNDKSDAMTVGDQDLAVQMHPIFVDQRRANARHAAETLAEPQQAYSIGRRIPLVTELIPLRIGGKTPNHIAPKETLLTIAVLATILLVALGSAVTLLTGLSGISR